MTMKNYRVEQDDGTVTFYQFDDSEEVGKAGLRAFRDAVKAADNPTTKIEQGDPDPINPGGRGR